MHGDHLSWFLFALGILVAIVINLATGLGFFVLFETLQRRWAMIDTLERLRIAARRVSDAVISESQLLYFGPWPEIVEDIFSEQTPQPLQMPLDLSRTHLAKQHGNLKNEFEAAERVFRFVLPSQQLEKYYENRATIQENGEWNPYPSGQCPWNLDLLRGYFCRKPNSPEHAQDYSSFTELLTGFEPFAEFPHLVPRVLKQLRKDVFAGISRRYEAMIYDDPAARSK